jgi:hypothetical protein
VVLDGVRHAPRGLVAVVLLVALVLAAGCASDRAGGLRPADVVVFAVPPRQAYEFVGTVANDGPAPTRNEAIAQLRERAAAIGADAVIVSERGNPDGPLRGIAIRLDR